MDYAVIMAGGTGKRLWPLSRKKRPKQVLKLLDGQTLLSHCYNRLAPLFDPRNIIVLTNADYVDTVRENLPQLLYDNIIAEPVVRDTASAIGLAATLITKFDPNATMAVVTADQLIEPDEALRQAIKDAFTFVNSNPDKMVTFGIRPSFPATQYGYIRCDKAVPCSQCKNKIYKVDAFREKPDLKTAESYLKHGSYFWNSGLFVFKAKTMLESLKTFLPDIIEPLNIIHKFWDSPSQDSVLREWFPKLPKISIDFAVMEKAPNLYAIELDCRWIDIGAFTALADFVKADENGNLVIASQTELLDCKNNVIITESDNHLIAAIGLNNIVIVSTPDATLVCPIEQTEKLKELLELIKQNKSGKYL